MNSVTLYPSLLSFGAAALATAFGRPDLAGNGLYMGAVVLVGFWLATVRGLQGDEDHGRAQQPRRRARHDRPGPGADLLHVRLADRRASRRPPRCTSSDVTPPFDGLSSIALVVGTFVAFAGLEVNAVHIKHLKGRPKSYFKAVLSAAAAGVRDVHARLDRDLGGRSGRHPRAHLGRVAGVHRLRRRVRDPRPLQPAVRPAGAGRGGRLDRLDRRPEPEHVARRPRRLPAAALPEGQQERRADADPVLPGRRSSRSCPWSSSSPRTPRPPSRCSRTSRSSCTWACTSACSPRRSSSAGRNPTSSARSGSRACRSSPASASWRRCRRSSSG